MLQNIEFFLLSLMEGKWIFGDRDSQQIVLTSTAVINYIF